MTLHGIINRDILTGLSLLPSFWAALPPSKRARKYSRRVKLPEAVQQTIKAVLKHALEEHRGD